MHWRFSNGIFEAIGPGEKRAPSAPYFVKSIDAETVEITIDDETFQSIFKISRVAEGFCASVEPNRWIPDLDAWNKSNIIECFAPYDG